MNIIKAMHAYGHVLRELNKTFFQMTRGVYQISKLPQPPVSIFGGSRLKMDSKYMQQAHQLAHKIAAEGIPVLTGGGPGIMEAANCGALHEGVSSLSTIGISVKGLVENGEGYNCCATNQITLEHFFARKWLLMRYSIGFVVFPGGYGTLDELTEILTLIQTKKFDCVPIIIMGTDYWKPFTDWLEQCASFHGLIEKKDLNLFTLTDSPDEVLKIIRKECKV